VADIILQQLRQLQRQANRSGRGDEMFAALQLAAQRLRLDARNSGEPTYRLPAMKLQIRCAVVPPLIFHFGVSEDRRVVYVKGIESLND
jgi:hypothetical protein